MKPVVIFAALLLSLSSCKKDGGYVNDPNISNSLHNRPVGASANELLSSSRILPYGSKYSI